MELCIYDVMHSSVLYCNKVLKVDSEAGSQNTSTHSALAISSDTSETKICLVFGKSSERNWNEEVLVLGSRPDWIRHE